MGYIYYCAVKITVIITAAATDSTIFNQYFFVLSGFWVGKAWSAIISASKEA